MLPIIVEGPDGAGKSTLIDHLKEAFSLPQAPRFSTSEGGPKAELFKLAWDDVTSWKNRMGTVIYDRHPLISDMIYGPVLRGHVAPGFSGSSARYLMQVMYREALVILCLPPVEVVRANVLNDDVPQLGGVADNIDTLYSLYQQLTVQWPTSRLISYDYTEMDVQHPGSLP